MFTRKIIVIMASLVLMSVVVLEGFNEADTLGIDDSLMRATPDKELAYKPDEIIVKFKKPVAGTLERQLSKRKMPAALKLTTSLDYLARKYKVKKIEPVIKNFKAKRQRIEKLITKDKRLITKKEKHLLKRLQRAPKGAKVPELDRIYKMELTPGQSALQAVVEYSKDTDVEYAELNYIVSIISTEPNDPCYPVQWPLANTGQMYPSDGESPEPPGTHDCDIDANEAWDIYTGSSDIIVAVIDTGVDYSHRDLANNMWINEDELNGDPNVDDDENGYVDDIYGYDFSQLFNKYRDSDPSDDHGHGTHCSGIIAADSNNGLDIAGVCWDAQIMAAKFLGPGGWGTLVDAVAAIEYAVDNGADITSNSWGGGGYFESLKDAIDYAHSQGVITIAAAGNDSSDDPNRYPANYDHVISVAATDSHDDKASFSNYGNWVDIAAPGVDILSLRAAGTSMGSVVDDYTTVAKGTSMACPHVSGACALLLSINPGLTWDDVNDLLLENVDTLSDPGICRSGRLNLYKSALDTVDSEGYVRLDEDYYSCNDTISIFLADADLEGNSVQDVSIAASGGDSETVYLSAVDPCIGVFTGSISTTTGEPNSGDNLLQLSHGETITVTYQDANDGTGNPASPNDTAIADCEGPVIFNIGIDATISIPVITFDTNEPAKVSLLCDVNCGEPYAIEVIDADMATSHSIQLKGLEPETSYFFIIEATDAVGNETTDSNDGQCYTFTTIVDLVDINVPGDYNTIQGAIDHSWDGDTIWVADGTYSGEGNYDIDFEGRSITVRSENGPNNCIINCQEQGRGFAFHSDEDANSVVDGFTIREGYPKINVNPSFWWDIQRGGAIFCLNSSPILKNCNIVENTAPGRGGGLYCRDSDITVSNCTFSQNTAGAGGGGMYLDEGCIVLTNCTIRNNTAGPGGGIRGSGCVLDISSCIIKGNSGGNGGGMLHANVELSMTNSIVGGNSSFHGGGIFLHPDTTSSLTNCTIVDNVADVNGGGIRCADETDTWISNCLLWNNTAGANDGNQIYIAPGESTMTVCYSDVDGGQSDIYDPCSSLNWGPGNMDSDPNFAFDDDYHIMSGSPCIDAGTNDPCGGLPNTDLDGNARPLDGDGDSNAVADMGAYEFNSSSPSIALSPDEFQFSCEEDGPDPNTQTLSIRNCGGGTLSWQVSEDCNWLSVDPCQGSSTGEIDTVTIGVDNNSLSRGDYECELTVSASGAVNTPRTVVVKLRVIGNLYVPSQYPTIQDAIDEAWEGDVVVVADGTYTGEGNRDIDFLGKAITVKSENGSNNCIIDCEGSRSTPKCGFKFTRGEDANSVLAGFTITNGYGQLHDGYYAGGGIYCEGSSPTIERCIIKENTKDKTNTDVDGGGIACYYGANPVIRNCIISDNEAYYSGAISCYDSNATIENCIITGNSAVYAGGIYFWGGDAKLINCTMSDNDATYGGGIEVFNVDTNPTFDNSILWGNTATYGDNVYHDGNAITVFSYSDIEGSGGSGSWDPNFGVDGGGNIDADPNFADANNGDYHLSYISPCIDVGDPNGDYEGKTDIDGQPRVIGDYVDMGADEVFRVHNVTQDLYYLDIQPALDDASNGDTIKVYPDHYYEAIDFDGVNCTLTSIDSSDWEVVKKTIIDANGASNVVHFHNGETINAVLKGFTLTGGGKGVRITSCGPKVRNCIIEYNTSDGVYFSNVRSRPIIEKCKIRHNTGKGIYMYTAPDTSSSPTFKNNWICDNSSWGVRVYRGSPKLTNNTIANNTSYGVNCMYYATVTIKNCILWGNGNDLSGCSATYSCIEDGDSGTGNISVDPCFINPDSNDYHLDLNSPCVDTGTNSGASGTDIDGDERVYDGDCNDVAVVDMGADEVYFPSCWSCDTQCHADTDCDGDVDIADFFVFKDSNGYAYPSTNYNPCADFDRDGDADDDDYQELSDNFGTSPDPNCDCGGTWPP